MRFVLVHGAGSGAWAWERLIPELESLGHDAVAIDLPGAGARRDEPATLDGYRDAVLDVLCDGDVLVGHSMGGYVISLVADAAAERVGHLIYLAAGVPTEGRSMVDATPLSDLGMDDFIRSVDTPHGPAFELRSPEAARELLGHDCDAQWGRRTFALRAPQQLAPAQIPLHLPRFWASDIPRSYVLCTEDRSGALRFVEGFLERLGLDRAYVIEGSHSAMVSRPRRTAEVLIAAAAAGGGRAAARGARAGGRSAARRVGAGGRDGDGEERG